jgi:hypothetical protein
MHIQTHILSGWCVADCFDLTPRERFFATVAASAADLDGLGILVSVECYAEYHHVLAHNALFGFVLASLLAVCSSHRLKAFGLFLALFHLHLIMDYYGSGLGWGIAYLWPFSEHQMQSPYAWELASWQNFVTGVLLLGWTILIVIRKHRTPLEFIAPSADKKIVTAFREKARKT